MKITEPKFHRIARMAGGISLGFRVHFPTSIWDGPHEGDPEFDTGRVPTNTTYQSVHVSIGLLLWEFRCAIDYDHKPIVKVMEASA